MRQMLIAASALIGSGLVAFGLATLLSGLTSRLRLRSVVDVGSLALLVGLAIAHPLLLAADATVGVIILPLAIVCVGQLLAGLASRPWLIWLPIVLLAALLLACQGVVIQTVKAPFTTAFVQLGPQWSALVTVLWLTLCAAIFNASAHSPGAALGVGGVASVGFLLVCLLQPQTTGPTAWALAAVVAGTCFGALAVQPTESQAAAAPGGLAVGFAIGALAILGALKNTAFLIAVLPLLLLGVPLVDATYAIVHGAGRPAGPALSIEPRSQRLHEVLLAHGYSTRQILALFMLGSAYLSTLAVLLVALIVVHFALKMLILAIALPLGGAGLYVVAKIMPRPIQRGAERPGEPPERIEAWNVRLSPVTMDEALSAIDDFVRSRSPHQIVTSDASAIVRAQRDTDLRRIMREADMVTADGAGVVVMARLLDLPIRERVPGCDMAYRICELSATRGYSLYLLGGEPGVAEKAAEHLVQRSPGLRIVGTQHGYFEPDEEPGIVEQIKVAQPDVLFVALGIPKQEKWIRRHMRTLGVPVCVGVGGSLDVIAGKVRRAPVWMQRCGLEWLYRTIREPRRLPRLAALPAFAIMTLRVALARRAHKRSSGANS